MDGRIHPARIEETVEKSRKEVESIIKQEGESATFETGVHGLHPELIKLLGKLKFRTSYGQNDLKHSIEVSHQNVQVYFTTSVKQLTMKSKALTLLSAQILQRSIVKTRMLYTLLWLTTVTSRRRQSLPL